MRVFLLLSILSLRVYALDFNDIIDSKDLRAVQNIIVTTATSCADKVVANPKDLGFAAKELQEFGIGIAKVLSEAALSLALKKDYPNACHVLSEEILAKIEEGEDSWSRCGHRFGKKGKCLFKKRYMAPKFSYYWPKYFIEVSNKGNDPHPAFASKNALYLANRKLANTLSRFIDSSGPYKLAAKVAASAKGIKLATASLTGQGFDLGVSKSEIKDATKSALLLPFEQLRIRATSAVDLKSFDVNIWPVGLSHSIASHLTVCKNGGYRWPFPGVPATCPIAMAKDAISYWDTGLLDYFSPKALSAMLSATNPASCIARGVADNAFFAPKRPQGERLSDEKGKSHLDEVLANLPKNLGGIRFCSFPILGDAEAIVSSALSSTSFSGPWCSLWGSVAPRASSAILDTEYSYPNAALRFKLLAHDLFGLERGQDELWLLSYPWETSLNERLTAALRSFGETLKTLGLKKIPLLKLHTPRSRLLLSAGDPRMIDLSGVDDLVAQGKNFAKEIAYLGALNLSANASERRALALFKKEHRIGDVSQRQALGELNKAIDQAEAVTAKLGSEPIFKRKEYCHVFKERGSHEIAGEKVFNLPIELGELGYAESLVSRCHTKRRGSCIDRHPLTRKCRRPQSIYYISFVSFEVVGYKKTQNPRVYKLSSPQCAFEQSRENNAHHRHYRCEAKLFEGAAIDTTERVKRADPKKISEAFDDSSTAKIAGLSAKLGVWVASEIARAKLEDLSGRSFLPGKKRVYTIFEKIECRASGGQGEQAVKLKTPIGWVWTSCKAAISYELRKYFQTRLLRRVCDKVFNYKLGEPFI